MTGEIIKSFLVGLGFDVDDASLAKFNKAIDRASVKIAALYGGIQLAATGIFAGISRMSAGFEEVGYQLRLVAPAINKMLILREAMLSAYRAAGIDLTKAVQQSILFNYSLAKTKFALEAVYRSVGIKFLPLLTKQMDIFRAKIFANMPKIQEQLTKLVSIIFKAFSVTTELGFRVWEILGRVWDFLKKLDVATNGWSTKILLAVAAWKLLNLEFLATPLGLVLTGLLAILALYDDFKVFKDGGKSFFNWTDVIPTIVAVRDVLIGVLDVGKSLALVLKDIFNNDNKAFVHDLNEIGYALIRISNAIDAVLRSFHISWLDKLLSFRDKIDSSFLNTYAALGDTLGGATAAPALASALRPAPLFDPAANSSQKVNQETNILVQGSADATSVGKSVANEQNKVNFDMTRNLKGAMR